MNKAKPIAILVTVLLLLGFGILFYVQNQDTQVVLFLDLLVWKGKLSNPASVPLLMFASFATGLALMGAYTLYTIFRQGSKDRRSRRSYARAAEDLDRDDDYDEYDQGF